MRGKKAPASLNELSQLPIQSKGADTPQQGQ